MIGERLRMIRESLGFTQRKLAKILGVSQAALAAHELGTSVPGGLVLEALCQLGVDGNWLLIGHGEMWRPDSDRKRLGKAPPQSSEGQQPTEPGPRVPERPRDVQDYARIEAVRLVERLGLGELALIGSGAKQRSLKEISQILTRCHPASLTLKTLCSRLADTGVNAEPRNVAADLALLMRSGAVVRETARGGARYRSAGRSIVLLASQLDDIAQQANVTLEALVDKIIPAALETPPRGLFRLGTLDVRRGCGREFARRIEEAARGVFEEFEREAGDEAVHIVLGAAFQASESS